ncbi:MAG: metal ABC transporter ATP-binding protein [Hyphomicrobiales bacterium]
MVDSRLDFGDTPLVSLRDAGLRRGGRWLVRGVDFSVRPGEIVTLIGPNGSGKSTSAKLAVGILAPTEGTVKRRAALRIGYVPQKLSVDWTMPLRVVQFMSLTSAVSAKARDEALGRTGSLHLLKRDLRDLSGGELQRVLLARAMVGGPELLVLDEPAQGVDFNGEIDLYELIRQVRDEVRCGVLLISHDLHVVMAATDHVICMNGHVCCHGTPEAVAASPEYHTLFGARAAKSLAIYQHHHDHTHLADGRVLHGDGSVTEHCHPGDGHHHAPAPAKPRPQLHWQGDGDA